jgi:hypothetical protein
MDDCFDDYDGPDLDDWAIIFPLAEDLARERRGIERIRRELDDADDDYWGSINQRW